MKTFAAAAYFIIAFGASATVVSKLFAQLRALGQSPDGLAQRNRISGWHEQSVFVVSDCTRDRAGVARHYGATRSHCFQHHIWQAITIAETILNRRHDYD